MAFTAALEPQVIGTYPRNLTKGVDAKAKIQITFNTDLDKDYIDHYIQVSNGEGTPVKGVISYVDRVVTFSPSVPFDVKDTIRVRIIGDDLSGNDTGIRSVVGIKMRGNYNLSFTISTVSALPPPHLLSPVDQTIITKQPEFDWAQVEAADHYQIQVSKSNTMNPIFWPSKWEEFKAYDTTDDVLEVVSGPDGYYVWRDPIDPSTIFEDGMYYWRMRAVSEDGKSGEWSSVQSFNIDTQVEGTVSVDDAPKEDIVTFEPTEYDSLDILNVFPEDEFANVATNLKTIYIHVSGIYTVAEVQNALTITGERVDGLEENPTLIHGAVKGTIDVIPQTDGTTIITFVMDPVVSS